MDVRVGDYVRCINDNGCDNIHRGAKYKVYGIDETCYLLNLPGFEELKRYKKSRFSPSNYVNWRSEQGEALKQSIAARLAAEQHERDLKNLYWAQQQEQTHACRAEFKDVDPVQAEQRLPHSYAEWCKFLASGSKLKFRSGCECTFVAFVPTAKPHCQLVLLSAAGNVFFRYADGRTQCEKISDPGDVLVA